MAVKYVKDFFFGPMTSVQRYAKGGHVMKVPARAKPAAAGMPARAKPNAPARGAARMESPPKMGRGQGYADGGRVPGYEKDVEPVSQPPGRGYDLAPSKPFKGAYEGYAKGGKVKGQAKVGKVMREYKSGELHSGSKKGPLVKNPKQAIAIALSEARKSGAKIPKKADGGVMDAYGNKKEPYRGSPKPKSVTVTKVTKTVSGKNGSARDAMLNEKKMREFLQSMTPAAEEMALEKRAMQAPAMDPDMPNYRRGGMARKRMPAHKSKAMYGGGKC